MGKALFCIKMLELLNTGKIYKISGLASFLETVNSKIRVTKKAHIIVTNYGNYYIS